MTLKPDLYAASVANDTQKVAELLSKNVPGTFIDTSNGWTVNLSMLFLLYILMLTLENLNVPQPLHWAAMHGNIPMTKALIEG